MKAADLYRLMENPALLTEDTLQQLKQIVDEFPYFQIARMLYLKNLAVLNDIRFGAELKKMAIYVPDRRKLFTLIEGERFGLQLQSAKEENPTREDAFSLIDAFLSNREEEEPKTDASLLFQPSVSSDYIYWSLTKENGQVEEKEEEEDEEDPRAELVRRLLEYKMYKYMAQELEEREQEAELLFFKEPTIPREVAKYEEPLDLDKLLDGLTLAKLQKVFDAVMKRNANKLDPVRSRFSTIRREPISLEQKVRSVLSYAREHRHFKFSDVLERESDRLEIVVAFLAVLELMKMGRIHLVQEKLFDEMQLDTVDVDETEDEAELELSTEEGEEYARIR